MKRYGNLWPQITDFENLWQAARQAQQGKRFRPSVLAFNHELEHNLLQLQTELQTKTYQPGDYHTFARIAIHTYLTNLRLRLHPVKTQLFETQYGLNFVGFRIFPVGTTNPREVYIRVRNDNLRRARKRCKKLQQEYAKGTLGLKPLVQRLQSWEAHLMHGDTHRLRRRLFDELVFRREYKDESSAVKHTLR